MCLELCQNGIDVRRLAVVAVANAPRISAFCCGGGRAIHIRSRARGGGGRHVGASALRRWFRDVGEMEIRRQIVVIKPIVSLVEDFSEKLIHPSLSCATRHVSREIHTRAPNPATYRVAVGAQDVQAVAVIVVVVVVVVAAGDLSKHVRDVCGWRLHVVVVQAVVVPVHAVVLAFRQPGCLRCGWRSHACSLAITQINADGCDVGQRSIVGVVDGVYDVFQLHLSGGTV